MFSNKLIKYTVASTSTIAVSYGYQLLNIKQQSDQDQLQGQLHLQKLFSNYAVCDAPNAINNTSKCEVDVTKSKVETRRSIPDQIKRFNKAKNDNNQRYLNIESVYEYGYVRGKSVLITGGNRGIGLELVSCYYIYRIYIYIYVYL